MSLEIRRAADRAVTSGAGRRTAHSLSFGAHYDPADVALGAIVAHNDDELDPTAGYDDHRHSRVEIVTWMVRGSLQHEHIAPDGRRHTQRITTGSVQVLSAGDGVVHAEHAVDEPARFIQVWLARDHGPARYATASVDVSPAWWTSVAGGDHAPVTLRCNGRLRVARSPTGSTLTVPAVALGQLFVVSGSIGIDGERLGDGDAVRLHDTGRLGLTALTPAEVLLWDLST